LGKTWWLGRRHAPKLPCSSISAQNLAYINVSSQCCFLIHFWNINKNFNISKLFYVCFFWANKVFLLSIRYFFSSWVFFLVFNFWFLLLSYAVRTIKVLPGVTLLFPYSQVHTFWCDGENHDWILNLIVITHNSTDKSMSEHFSHGHKSQTLMDHGSWLVQTFQAPWLTHNCIHEWQEQDEMVGHMIKQSNNNQVKLFI
jgi:hypothetical protein